MEKDPYRKFVYQTVLCDHPCIVSLLLPFCTFLLLVETWNIDVTKSLDLDVSKENFMVGTYNLAQLTILVAKMSPENSQLL